MAVTPVYRGVMIASNDSRAISRSAAPSAPVTPAAQPTSTTSYFNDIPRSTTPAGFESDPDTNVWADRGALGGTTSSASSSDVAPERAVTDKPSKSSMRQRGSSVGSSQVINTQPQSRIASRKPSGVLQARQTELAGTTYTWSNSSEMGLGSKTSLAMHDHPFADSKAAAIPELTNTVVSPTETIHVAETIDPRSPRDNSMFPPAEPQAVPLPAMYEVMAAHAIRQPSSNYFNQSGSEFVDRARYNGHFDVEGSHVPESTTPLFVIGACACLVSAIILSASVTLMSLETGRREQGCLTQENFGLTADVNVRTDS
ncbi:hypothetical protein PAXINDRAFT_102374 [Paxillus involutus ATCC 200175]|uniref:Uncharacterized protein n=1 Tax=Paxillus involutus ATCC 200175 TaxID=664439 RepID=A0A0C9TMN1_PAXIN|nr:hypothetical protein PAXINDRAFT_102374 [Paxillus involutus ATCC 200175]